MKFSSKLILTTSVILVLVISAGFYLAGSASLRQLFPYTLSKSGFDSIFKEDPVMTGFQFSEYMKGNKILTVRADKFYVRNRKVNPLGFRIAFGKSAEMESVDATFYKDNKPVACLHSRSAVIDNKNKNIRFEGRPFLLTSSNRVLKAREILWDNSDKKLLAIGNCFLGTKEKIYEGTSLKTDAALEDFTVETSDRMGK